MAFTTDKLGAGLPSLPLTAARFKRGSSCGLVMQQVMRMECTRAAFREVLQDPVTLRDFPMVFHQLLLAQLQPVALLLDYVRSVPVFVVYSASNCLR